MAVLTKTQESMTNKITLRNLVMQFVLPIAFVAFSWQGYAQFSFPVDAGPYNVVAGTPFSVSYNDAVNSAGVPSGQYGTFTVTVDWAEGSGGPWSSEAELTVTTSNDVVLVDPPSSGAATNGNATTLTFSGILTNAYDPDVDASFELTFNQSFVPSDADWSNILIELGPVVPVPDNDLCENATPINCGDAVTGSTANGSDTSGAPSPDVFYTLSGTANNEEVTVSLCGSSFDTILTVFDACDGSIVVQNDDFCGLQSELTFVSDGTTTYIIRVEGFGSNSGDYALAVSCVPPPTCPEPSDLTASNITGTSADVAWTENGTATVWVIEVVDVTAGGTATGTPTDTGVANPATLTGLTAGNTYEYYVRADCGGDTSSWVGPFAFTTAGDCSTIGSFAYGNNSDASNSINFFVDTPGDIITLTFTAGSTEACCDQWFVTDGANGTGSVIDSGFGSIVGAYESTTGEISFYVVSDGTVTGTTFEYAASCTTPSTDTPDFFNLQFPATGDIIVGDEFLVFAQVFEGGVTDVSDTPASGIEAWIGYSTVDSSPDTDSDWTWIPATTNPSFDFTTNNDEYFLDLGAEVPGVGTYYYASRWSLNNGPFVYGGILPDGSGGGEWGQNGWASGVLSVSEPPAPDNDLCENATPISCGDTLSGTTDNATNAGAPIGGCTVGGVNSGSVGGVWYTFEGTGDTVTASTCNTASFDTEITVFTGVCADLTCLGNNDDGTDCSGFTSEFEFESEVGTTYYIYVSTFGSTTGTFDLSLTCVAPPTCPVPTDFAPTTQTPTVTTFTWAPGGDETSWEFALSQPDATEPEPATVVTEPTANAGHDPGQTILYWVRAICGPDNFSDWVTVEYTSPLPAPENDLLADAIPVACGDTVLGTTINATLDEADAPEVATVEPDTSADVDSPWVWYSYTGTIPGERVTLSTCGVDNTDFDTEIFVYTGTSGALTLIDDGFDECGGSSENFAAETSFDSDGVTTYFIAIGGWNAGNVGNFQLSVTCESLDPCPNNTTYEWTGTADTNWENASNWLDGNAPGLSIINGDVLIPVIGPETYYYPVLTVGQDLYIDECSSVTIEADASMTVNPNVVVSNDGTMANDGHVTFQSDHSGTAYVGPGMGMFIGEYTVERFIPAKRAYRQMSPAVTTSTPISENWQQDTHITGPAGNTDGFDVTQTGNPSAYIFDNVLYDYIELENTNATNLVPGTMYHILVRGDRNTDLTNNNATPSNTTLKATGELTADNTGFQTITVDVPEQRFIAVGNPFQAQVDMNEILTTDATNINPNFYWIWDPTLGERGAYTAIVAATGVASAGDSDANQYLQSGQAGWVYTEGAGSSSVTFTQSSKFTGTETDVFRTENSTSLGQLRLSLYESSAHANNETAADAVLIMFDANGNNEVDANDALNITNLDENMATNNNGVLLSIENRAAPQNQEEIQLEINTYRSTNYVIVAEGMAIQDATPFLLDQYTGSLTEIPQSGSVSYSFTADSNISASISGGRFKIVFEANALSVDSQNLEDLLIYPNPNTGIFYLDVPVAMDDLDVTVYSVLGVKVYNENGFSAGQRVTIDTSRVLSAGTYLVELSSNGNTTTKKLIIN